MTAWRNTIMLLLAAAVHALIRLLCAKREEGVEGRKGGIVGRVRCTNFCNTALPARAERV